MVTVQPKAAERIWLFSDPSSHPICFHHLCPQTPWTSARHWNVTWGGHEPRVHAAVCFWLCRGSGGHQLCCAGLSVSAAAGSLLCLYRRLTCPALLTLLTQTQQVQRVCVCVFVFYCLGLWKTCTLIDFVLLCGRCQIVAMQSFAMWIVIQSGSMRPHTKSRSRERGVLLAESHLDPTLLVMFLLLQSLSPFMIILLKTHLLNTECVIVPHH